MSTTPLEITFFRLLRENTYQLVEDTFLLLDGLEQDAQVLRDQKPLICLEVGCVHRTVFLRVHDAPKLAQDQGVFPPS